MEDAAAKGSDAETRARGMEYAHTFEWGKTARQVMAVYESLI